MTIAMRALGALAGALLMVGCVSNERFEAASTEVENQDEVIRKLRDDVQRLERTNLELQRENELSQAEIQRLRSRAVAAEDVGSLKSELERLRQAFKDLEHDDSDIIVRQTADGPALSVAGNVVFKTASHDISDRGREILTKVADRLKATQADIRVEGHTDNVPIVRNLTRYPLGNLELSGRRAMAVADFLIETCGISRARISFAGYGAERPVADNGSDEGRRENRRVDIVVLQQER